MVKCEKCNKEFERDEAEYEFESRVYSSFPVSCDRFGKDLCVECALEEFKAGNYTEECECCGKEFNPQDDEFEFERLVSHKVLDADMFEYGILCAECAAKKLFESLDETEEF